METCKTCSFWERNVRANDSRNHGECRVVSLSYNSNALPAGVAISYDFDRELGNLVTGPNFGCVHHEIKVPD